MTRIVSLANQKGGVGKTTSAVNIAASLAVLGKKVLLLDMDPQGSSTSGVGVNKKNVVHTSYEVLLGQCGAEDAVLETKYKNLSVMPANIALAAAEFELIDAEKREFLLKTALEPLKASKKFDFIIIDCPPSLSLITINALTASDGLIIPMQCEYYALEGLTQLTMTVKKVKQYYNPSLAITGILITMYNARLNLSVQVLGELEKYYGDKLFKTRIIRAVALSEAPSFGAPIYYYDKYSKGSMAYTDVAKELIERI